MADGEDVKREHLEGDKEEVVCEGPPVLDNTGG